MKVLFSDMDGTVIDQTEILHKKDVEMMHALKKAGHKLVFNTGRNYQEALFSVNRHGFPYDYLILNNGAHIVDNKGNEIFKREIPGSIGKKIIEYCLTFKNLWIFFYNGYKTIGYLNGKTYEHNANGIVELEAYDFLEEYRKVDTFDIFAINQVDHHTDILLHVQKYIEKYYGEHVTSCLNQEYLDITPSGCTKGTGVMLLRDILEEEIEAYCVGDSYNDISMFAVADHAYTFHRVDKDIEEHVDKQIQYVHELIADMLGGNYELER